MDGPENWGTVRLEGDNDLSLSNMLGDPEHSVANGNGTAGVDVSTNSQQTYMRNLGMGIEGRPFDALAGLTSKSTRRASAVSWSSGKATIVGIPSTQPFTSTKSSSSANRPALGEGSGDVGLGTEIELIEDLVTRRRMTQVSTTMALLQTFHAHTSFQLSVLEDLFRQRDAKSNFSPTTSGPFPSETGTSNGVLQDVENTLTLTPRDILSFELGPFSSLDAKYLEWLATEYTVDGVNVVVRRGWRDLLGFIFGYG